MRYMKNKYVYVITANMIAKVDLDCIYYIERTGRKIYIVTDENSYEFNGKLEAITKDLDDRFYPSLKSLYINFDNILSMYQGEIIFSDKVNVVLGMYNFRKTKEAFREYIETRKTNR